MSLNKTLRERFERCLAPLPPWLRVAIRWFFGVRSVESLAGVPPGGITVVIPAYQEAANIARTIKSIQKQTHQASEIIVIDDCSQDQTAEIATGLGVKVVRQLTNQGKAAAQKLSLAMVKTEFVIFIDADTVLTPNAFEKMMPYFNETKTAAVGGYILPLNVETFWEKARQYQYHFGQAIFKAGQNNSGTIFVSSGCFTAFRTSALRQVGITMGTLAEDLGTTWAMLEARHHVRFAPDALCYVMDPKNLNQYWRQAYRWNVGYFQNIKLRRCNLFPIGLGFAILTYFALALTLLSPLIEAWALWSVGSYSYASILHAAGLGSMPDGVWRTVLAVVTTAVIGFGISLAWTMAMSIPVFLTALRMRSDGRFWLTVRSIVPFLIAHYLVDVLVFYKAFWDEIISGRWHLKWEKGNADESSWNSPRRAIGASGVQATTLARQPYGAASVTAGSVERSGGAT